MPEAYYDLYVDTREDNPMLIPLIHTQGQFNRMRARHELMKRKYPDKKNGLSALLGKDFGDLLWATDRAA